MINVSSAWHRALFNDNRNYIEQIKLTLQDNTVINLTNENIWGGAKFDDAVSGDSDFQIGAAIVNKLIFNINNIYDDFSEYDFGNAKVEAKIGLVTDEGTEIIKKGTYTVNSASYNGSLINLECYDYMAKFEKPYSDSTLVYPATLDTIVRGACTDCGVVLQTLDFPHKTFVIQERPDDDNCSYREIIAWCAQIAGCFARCNVDGKLELKWYDQDAINNVVGDLDGGIFDNGTPSYTSGDTADGGTFNPWITGYVHDSGSFTDSIRAHHIDSLYSHDISVDDVIITGIRILVNSTGTNPIEPVLVGTLGYVIEISNNPLITTTNASQIATWLGTQLIGFTFRKAQISHGSDPSIEAGDVAFVIDGKARTYPIVISHTVFAVGSAQSTTSSAQTPARNSAQRYGTETKNYVELRKALKSEKTAREQAEDDLADAIANANGLYETTIENELTHAVTYYLHNKEHLSDSAIRIMFSDVGITVTADGGQHWYGLTASGDMITHLLSATGINADWINTGQLVIEDAQHNETFFADADSGVVRIAPTQFTLTPANQQYIQNTANSAASGAVSAFENGDYATFVSNTNTALGTKITTFYQNSAPTASVVGDLWIDTTDNCNEMYRWDGTDWSSVQDKEIQSALVAAGNAKDIADRKIATYAQTSAPTGSQSEPLDVGDIWIDTDDYNKLYRYNGQSWLPYTDSSALQTWITGTYASDKSDLQTQIDGKIQTWRQDEDPVVTEGWSDTATKQKHKGDIWYCTSEDIIPSWLSSYVNTETGMTALVSSRVDDGWYEISNAVNFTIDGATSTNIYIDTNSVFAFANTQPSTSGRSQAYNLNICRRDGQAISIKYQVIESGSNKAVKVRYNGYTEYQQSNQTEEYANEYEVFFTNANEIYINTIKQPTHTYTSSLIDTSIKDNGTTVSFSLIADTHASIKKVSGAWVVSIDQYSGKSWMYDLINGVYSWQVMDSGIPEELLDEIDGKSSIYTTASAPTDAQEGDLWFKGVSDPIKTYHNGQWVEYNKYTDDTAANAYTDSKILTYDTNLNQSAVFNKLTNNGSAQGIFLENGNLYINMSYLKTGTLVVGGTNNASGIILVKGASGNTYGRWDNNGIKLGGTGDSQTSPKTTISGNGLIQVSFDSSKYIRMNPSGGFEVQGSNINAKLYSSDWTYQRDDSSDPGEEKPDYGINDDIADRPGYYEKNTALKITDSYYTSRGTYNALGKNYIEIAYASSDFESGDIKMAQLKSTNSGQYLTLKSAPYSGNEYTVILSNKGFEKVTTPSYDMEGGNSNGPVTIGGKTYYIINGILCQ